jgi:hypothetical protein
MRRILPDVKIEITVYEVILVQDLLVPGVGMAQDFVVDAAADLVLPFDVIISARQKDRITKVKDDAATEAALEPAVFHQTIAGARPLKPVGTVIEQIASIEPDLRSVRCVRAVGALHGDQGHVLWISPPKALSVILRSPLPRSSCHIWMGTG